MNKNVSTLSYCGVFFIAGIDDAQYNSRRVDGICLWENGYELTQNPATVNYGSDYNTRKRRHLLTL